MILDLKGKLLKENVANMQVPAVWGNNTSYNNRFFQVGWREESTMVKLYQALDQENEPGIRDSADVHRSSERTISVTITAIPAHLASGAVHLLVGKSGDDLTRILFLPRTRPPEIKYLRVTLNHMLDELATRSKDLLSAPFFMRTRSVRSCCFKRQRTPRVSRE